MKVTLHHSVKLCLFDLVRVVSSWNFNHGRYWAGSLRKLCNAEVYQMLVMFR